MTLDEYNRFCGTLAAATHVVQWGGHDVWKVGGKVFAIGGGDAEGARASFKVTPLAFEMLKEEPGCRPAPYLASRGMTWIQAEFHGGLNDAALRDYLVASHGLVAAGLSKKRRRELGLEA